MFKTKTKTRPLLRSIYKKIIDIFKLILQYLESLNRKMIAV